ACLREDRWLVHHLASDLPVSEVTDLVKETAASLVVLSAATAEAVQRAAKAEIWSFCSDSSVEAGPTTRRVTPFAAWAATSSAVMSMAPQRVYSSAAGSRPAARAVSRIRSSWAARSASVRPPPGK